MLTTIVLALSGCGKQEDQSQRSGPGPMLVTVATAQNVKLELREKSVGTTIKSMITSALLTLVVVPALYSLAMHEMDRFEAWRASKVAA